MNLEQHVQLKTVDQIFEWHEENRKSEHRPHLGGSQIGNACSRALFYQFRHADRPVFDGRMIRLFLTGDLEEDRFVKELRGIGVKVWDRDPDTGKQIRFTACGGHFALSVDGVVENLPDAPKKPHILELKTANEKSFTATAKMGVEKAKPIYYAQCQIAMHLSGIHDCLFMMKNKNTDAIYGERLKYDAVAGMQLVAKAERIVFAEKPPAKISNDPAWYECKFCSFNYICHGDKIPEANCRTCARSTPEKDGSWSCAKGHAFGVLCQDHLYNPYIMPYEVDDAGDDYIQYVDEDGIVIRNENGNSVELAAAWVPF